MQDFFRSTADDPLSRATLYAMNSQAHNALETFETKVQQKLLESRVVHANEKFCTEYRKIIEAGEIECPRVTPPPKRFHQSQKKRRGKIKQSKSRNLLERLRDFENEVLRFASDPDVPFTNNQGEVA